MEHSSLVVAQVVVGFHPPEALSDQQPIPPSGIPPQNPSQQRQMQSLIRRPGSTGNDGVVSVAGA